MFGIRIYNLYIRKAVQTFTNSLIHPFTNTNSLIKKVPAVEADGGEPPI